MKLAQRRLSKVMVMQKADQIMFGLFAFAYRNYSAALSRDVAYISSPQKEGADSEPAYVEYTIRWNRNFTVAKTLISAVIYKWGKLWR